MLIINNLRNKKNISFSIYRSQNIMNEQKKKELLSSKGKSWGVKFGTRGSKSSGTQQIKNRKSGSWSLESGEQEVKAGQLNKAGTTNNDPKNPNKEVKGPNKSANTNNTNKKRLSKGDIGKNIDSC